MSGRWFKMAETIFLDRRLQRLPASLFRLWANLQAVASWSGGRLPSIEDCAFLLRTSAKALSRRLDALKLAGLVSIGEAGEVVIVGAVDGEPRASDDRPAPMSAAERQRAWRERRRGVTAGETPSVTGETRLEREEIREETDSPRVTRGERDDSSFDQFLAAYPQRDEPTPRAPALAAWRKAIGDGADPAEIVTAARRYAAATAGRERRFIASAARWLAEGRWRGEEAPKAATPPAIEASGHWIEQGSAAWAAWASYWRETKGRTPPTDAKGGWRFPAPLPPIGMAEAAA